LKTKILNVNFDVITKNEAVDKLLNYLKEDKNHLVFTPNPEMVMLAKKDKEFLDILNKGDLVIADGIGIVLASKLNKIKINERVPGCDVAMQLLSSIKDKNYTVYLLGGKKGVSELAKEKMEKKYGVKIIGTNDGYFDCKQDKIIVNEINKLKPHILLVGLGMPRQEKWIYKYKDILEVRISMGVGGTIDVMSGTVNRAPVICQKLGIEWLYRLFKQPSRWIRILQIPLFVFNVTCSYVKSIINK
jgi:N-acetylglucosaminyldiphosphoundecaprenol N-acetyl-beta-D-mannosaminyltransferase